MGISATAVQTTAMNGPYNALLRRLGHRRWFAALGPRIVPIDRWITDKTGGRFNLAGHNAVPQLLLTTTGRKTGQARTTPLLYARAGEDWIVTASNWGLPHHPAWSSNLIANPAACIKVGSRRIDVDATLAEGDERDRLWATVIAVWPAYDTYVERSGREIRVFRLVQR